MAAILSSLRIRNLALVDELEWALGRGFTAITGETGSGKSIIVGALKLLLGERADKSLIRTGEEQCTVEGVFELDDTAALDEELEAQGLERCADGLLILKRVFSASGTNRQFVNCSATTLAVLKTIAAPLVDLHGPHDHQSLLSNERQLELLDSFAGAAKERAKYADAYRSMTATRTELETLSHSESALEREIDLLRHQVVEIEAAALNPEEEETLLPRYQRASGGQRLLELATQLDQRLGGEQDAVLSSLRETQRLCHELERIDPAAAEFAEAHQRAVVELEELARTVQRYAEGLDLDPQQIAQLEERVSVIESLKRKYGRTVPDVIAFGKEAAERLQRIESRGEELARLERELDEARKAVEKAGKALSQKRRAALPKLAQRVKTELRGLGFKKSEFEVTLSGHAAPGASGLEGTEFLIGPNPGEPLKPLKAIASSGEISRLMLAIKTALAAEDTVPLMIFDEIDANVGGEIAHAVGARMRSLGEQHQVLAITHLPQVAAAAGAQFQVTKEYSGQRTFSRLIPVEGKARTEEIARMLGGKTASALAHAETMLTSSR